MAGSSLALFTILCYLPSFAAFSMPAVMEQYLFGNSARLSPQRAAWEGGFLSGAASARRGLRTQRASPLSHSCSLGGWDDLSARVPKPSIREVRICHGNLSCHFLSPHPSLTPILLPNTKLPANELSGAEAVPKGKMVLFRDRNGWCPYSERVWLAMLEKRLSFDEVLINLQVLTEYTGELGQMTTSKFHIRIHIHIDREQHIRPLMATALYDLAYVLHNHKIAGKTCLSNIFSNE